MVSLLAEQVLWQASLSNHSGVLDSPFDTLRACPVLDTGVSEEKIFFPLLNTLDKDNEAGTCQHSLT